MKNIPNLKRIAALALTVIVAACGGSSGGGNGTDTGRIASGTPDPTYGNAGRATIAPPDIHSGLAVDAAGNAYVTGQSIVKLDAAGRVVRSYGDAGRVPVQASSPLIDEAGNLFAIGDGRLIKVDASGRLVPSFGDGTRIGSLRLLVRDAGGGFYAIGSTDEGPSPLLPPVARIIVMKFDRDGRIDPTYGAGGTRIVDPPAGTNQFARAAAVDRQGNLHVAGSQTLQGHRPDRGDELVMLVLKLDPRGNLVADFGTAGAWRSPTCNGFVGASAIALDGGNVYVGGTCSATAGGIGQAVIWKLDAQGVPVATFGSGGMRSAVFGTPTDASPAFSTLAALLPDASGHIYASGRRRIDANCVPAAVVRLDAAGRNVQSFANAGEFVVDMTNSDALNLAMDAAGRLHVGVQGSGACPFTNQPSFAVLRLVT